jgi:hypothetical protein
MSLIDLLRSKSHAPNESHEVDPIV